jgi:hypothetical protein
MDWIRAVEKVLGAKIHKAKSNSPQLRNEAIWQAMDKRGGYAVDPSCKHLIRAHLGGYHYRKAEIAAGDRRRAARPPRDRRHDLHPRRRRRAIWRARGRACVADIRGRDRREGRTVVNDSNTTSWEGYDEILRRSAACSAAGCSRRGAVQEAEAAAGAAAGATRDDARDAALATTSCCAGAAARPTS